MLDAYFDYVSSSKILILGGIDLWFGYHYTRTYFDLLVGKFINWKFGTFGRNDLRCKIQFCEYIQNIEINVVTYSFAPIGLQMHPEVLAKTWNQIQSFKCHLVQKKVPWSRRVHSDRDATIVEIINWFIAHHSLFSDSFPRTLKNLVFVPKIKPLKHSLTTT